VIATGANAEYGRTAAAWSRDYEVGTNERPRHLFYSSAWRR